MSWSKRMVSGNLTIALGIVCAVLIVGLGTYLPQINSKISNLQNQVDNVTNILNSTPYVHSQLLENEPPTPIPANGNVAGWVLNWTPTTDVRIVKIQVWMGNPDNVTWEGDTYVTIGKPIDPSNSSSYDDSIQLLVHYQFDSHAPSPIPHQLMFDLASGFKVVLGQTINVWRDFVNTESYTVYSGDVQVIIYYENI